MKFFLIVGMLICGWFGYMSYSAYSNEDEYVEACLYISNTFEEKRGCYNVYPEGYKKGWVIKGILSVVGVAALGAWYWIITPEQHLT